jgi:hypothetical protein
VSQAASFRPPFISLRPSARWATGLLLATVALAWVAVGVELADLRLLFRASRGSDLETGAVMAQFTTQVWLLWIRGVLLVATAVAFLLWLYQARVNLRAFGVRRPRFPRGATVWSFLIPLINLFRPYQVMREIWQASDPGNLDAFNWRSLRVPPLLWIWWGCFVAALSLQVLALLTNLGSSVNLARLQLSGSLTTLADLVASGAAMLACQVVGRLSDAQEQKWEIQEQAERAAAEAARQTA